MLLILVTATPLTGWWARCLAGSFDEPQGEVLVVLGGAVGDEGIVTGGSYWRSVYAAQAIREGKFREVILSGEGAAEAMRGFLLYQGVAASSIRVEPRSKSTLENAREVAPLVRAREVVLLTSDYHMYRSAAVFEKAGIRVKRRPIPDAVKRSSGWRGRWPAFLDLTIEVVKIGWYRANGWL